MLQYRASLKRIMRITCLLERAGGRMLQILKKTRRGAAFPKSLECDKILIKCVTEGLFWNLLSRKAVRLWQILGSSTGITMR